MDEDATWYVSRPPPRPHCIRRVPALRETGTAAPIFSARVYCGHGRPSQLLLSSCFTYFSTVSACSSMTLYIEYIINRILNNSLKHYIRTWYHALYTPICHKQIFLHDLLKNKQELSYLAHPICCHFTVNAVIIFGILETDVSAFFTISSTNNFTCGHFKLLMPQSRIDVRKYFFACRIVRCWNSLDAEPEHVSSLTAFKKFLQQIYVV